MEYIKFKDLSIWLKISAITGWIAGIYWLILFIIGFIIGVSLR